MLFSNPINKEFDLEHRNGLAHATKSAEWM